MRTFEHRCEDGSAVLVRDAFELMGTRFASNWTPAPAPRFSQWLQQNIVLVDGPDAGQLWSPRGAPYLPEIADCLGDDYPCNLVTVRKAEQTGASILALAWCLFIADCEPANVLYAAPSIDLLRDLNAGKLQPLIDAWQRRTNRIVIKAATSRSASGSSTWEKVYARGRLWLANANAATELSSRTIKKGIKDELSKWKNLESGADPETLFFGRFTAFRRSGDYKILEISTPEVDFSRADGLDPDHCRIDRSFRASDQRFWHVPCPQCREFFVHDVKHLRVDEENPRKSAYICQNCGYPITDADRPAMIRAGEWRPTAFDGERHPGFHIDAFISLMMSYEAIGRDLIKSRKGDETAAKDFYNLKLGLPYRFRGSAPDHSRLMERREDLKRGHIPPRGLILVGAGDVQKRGIYFEVVAFAETRESWVVDADYIDGDTDSPDSPAFEALRKRVVDRQFPDAWGRTRKVDAFGIDSGWNSNAIYAWVRSVQRMHALTGENVVFALKGDEGWAKQALALSSTVDIDLAGRKIRKGTALWRVGTWPLKSSFYAELEKLGMRSGQPVDPPGYCHFPNWLEENYFKQITAETLSDEIFRGRRVQVWKLAPGIRDNHFLDCRIYNKALAEHLGLSKLTDEEWRGLASERGAPAGGALPLWTATSGAEAAAGAGAWPPAEAAAALAPGSNLGPSKVSELTGGDAGLMPAWQVSPEQIEQIRGAVAARDASASRAWPPRRS
jgi:phage terminase large subunit GpA-like protein